MVDLKRNVTRACGRGIPKLYFENVETELSIASLYDNKKDIYEYLALILLRLGFEPEDSILICNYDKENNSFDCVRNNVKDCRLYIDKDNEEIVQSKHNENYGYKCIPEERSELGMIISLGRYVCKYEDGTVFTRYLSRDKAKFVVEVCEYRLEFEVDRPEDIKLRMFDENGKYAKYRLFNEEELVKYLSSSAMDKQITDIYKDLSEYYLDDISKYPNFYLREFTLGEEEKLTDLIHLKNGKLEKFGMTDYGMTVFVDKDDNWSYEVPKDDAVPANFSMTYCEGTVSCNFSFNESETDLKKYIDDQFNSEVETAMEEVRDVRRLVRRMFN